jgi:ABC-2 type transport system permease protein
MLLAQTRAELVLVLRNGEQVLLSLVIPLALVVLLVTVPFISLDPAVDGERADFFVPGVLALAVMSAAFTGQAIAVGFERQYGVLKRLGATALPRSVLLAAKTLAVLAVELLQVALLCAVGLALGWDPSGSPLSVLVLVVVGTAAFSGLGLLLGGTMRGLTTLAAANLLWFVLLVLGGVLFPLSAFGPPSRSCRCCPRRRCPPGCATCCRTARCPCARCSSWPSGASSGSPPPAAPSAGSSRAHRQDGRARPP